MDKEARPSRISARFPSFSRGLLRARPSIAAPPSGPLVPFDAASGECGACATAASLARGGVRRRPRPPLLAPHRGGLRRVGEALHPVPRQAPPLTLGSEEIDAFLTDLAVE